MPTVNYTITSNTNDVASLPAYDFHTDLGVSVGEYYGDYIYAAWRFLSIDIPAGAGIISASLTLTHNTSGPMLVDPGAGSNLGRVYGVAQTNASALTPSTISTLPKTSAFGLLQFVDTSVTINVTSILQELIQLPGWTEGNAIALLADPTTSAGGAYREFYDYNNSTTLCAKLTVEYEEENSSTPPPVDGPTGGTVSYNGNHTIHIFRSSGIFNPKGYSLDLEYLIVAGGGGGGYGDGVNRGSGGGGAGGVLFGSLSDVNSNLNITVGAGGASDTNGQNSSIDSIIAIGGGAGGHSSTSAGSNGGSGGGGGGRLNINGAFGLATAGQGHNGSAGSSTPRGGGAGGGAGTPGVNTASGGHGGNGIQSNITGTSVYYAGGGGGGLSIPGTGGLGGGASGGNNTTNNAPDNTGGGGGGVWRGGGLTGVTPGGSGGSGIVIIKYLTPTESTEPNPITTKPNRYSYWL